MAVAELDEQTRPTAAATSATRRRVPGWTIVGVVIAAVVAGPLLALPLSFVGGDSLFEPLARTVLPVGLRTSVLLGLGVGICTFVVGTGLAILVSFYDFPGRKTLDWALVLPLAMPAYVLVFVVLAQYGIATPLQSNLFGAGLQIPGVRTPMGAVVILSMVLYPYVYILGRSAFMGQSRQSIEAARSLGCSYGRAVWRVAVPLARPSLAAGVVLAVMEALADFGAVNLLGVQAMTAEIYRLWFGAFNEAAALQLATVLVGLALALVAIERLLRGRARYHQQLGRGDAIEPRQLHGWRSIAAAAPAVVLLLVVFALPVAQLAVWSIESIVDGGVAGGLASQARNSLLLAVSAAALTVLTATIVVYGQRTRPSRLGNGAARVATMGYAVPGTVVAVAVFAPLIWIDRRLIDVADGLLGTSIGLVFTGSILGLVIAYVIRFHTLAYFSVESRMGRIEPNLDDAAQSLGADGSRVLAEVHLPLLWPGILTGALLVLVDVMKELPATALLRPLGGDTLAIGVWEATKDSRYDAAALPALLIVAVGLVPVILLVRLLRGEGWTSASERI